LLVVGAIATWLLVQAQRETHYRSILAQYQQRFHPGMTRIEVDNSLGNAKNGVVHMGGSGNSWSYIVRIGTEHNPLIFGCGETKVYVALDFDSAEPTKEFVKPPGQPSDILKDTRTVKMMDCL
jgi:hypothetical protein